MKKVVRMIIKVIIIIFIKLLIDFRFTVHKYIIMILKLNARFRYKMVAHSAVVESTSHSLWSEHLRFYASSISYMLLTARNSK